MTGHRVVVTGLGPVTAIGTGVDDFARGLKEGREGISAVERFDVRDFSCRVGGEIKEFDAPRWVQNQDPEALGLTSMFAVAGARLAVADAGGDPGRLSRGRVSVVMGSTEGESLPMEQAVAADCGVGAPDDLSRDRLRRIPAHRIGEAVAKEFDLHGEVVTLGAACAAGNYAIGLAYDMISLGETECVLAGGAESLSRKGFAGFYRLGIMEDEHCRPFTKGRKGMLSGEGAGVLLLESLDHARARGARIYGEVLGYGISCDAHHMTSPSLEGVVRSIRLAHEDAGIGPEQVEYICAHGTGTPVNDRTESAAIREVFGSPPALSSIKSMLGHTMGAASSLASISGLLGMRDGFLPPTINAGPLDPECDIDCVPNIARDMEFSTFQSHGFGFGGTNCVVVFSKGNLV